MRRFRAKRVMGPVIRIHRIRQRIKSLFLLEEKGAATVTTMMLQGPPVFPKSTRPRTERMSLAQVVTIPTNLN